MGNFQKGIYCRYIGDSVRHYEDGGGKGWTRGPGVGYEEGLSLGRGVCIFRSLSLCFYMAIITFHINRPTM